ncbi:MAG: hypothetical protein HQL99_10110 [Magnetococcales bacterium]|nr:hypothetical protein [Magnetococcales bacterium]
MAIFLLIREQESGGFDPASWLRRLDSEGLRCAADIREAGWRLCLVGSFHGPEVPLVRRPDGDLAAAVGWFAFDGQGGTEGVRRALESFDGRQLDGRRCRGHFILVMRKAGCWYLARDGLDCGKVYHDLGERCFSNSFQALLAAVRHPEPDPQGCYEYAFNGATFGEKSFIRQIRMAPAESVTRLDGATLTHLPVSGAFAWNAAESLPSDCEAAAGYHLERLRELFRFYAGFFPQRLRTAISGGYDSRLILALLLEAGVRPELFVFGPEQGDADVTVARQVAAVAGLPLEVINKSRRPGIAREGFREQVARNVVAFDAWKPGGLFDNGVDLADRLARSQDRVLLNGSAGEIYRNFYYLPDRPMALREVVRSFYSRLDPAAVTGAFSRRGYGDAMTGAMRRALGAPDGEGALERGWVERSYPLFRGRFWSSRDLNLNLRFGPALYPFLEAGVVRETWRVPMACKHLGRLEARMIQLAAPELAACASVYGHAFTQEPFWRYRLATRLTLLRPIVLREYSYAIQQRRGRGSWPTFLTPEWLGEVLDTTFPIMGGWFRMERIRDPEVYNRVATMEYLLQNGGA